MKMYVRHQEKQTTGVLHPSTDVSPPPNFIGDAEQGSSAAPLVRSPSTSTCSLWTTTSARLSAELRHLSSSHPPARRRRPAWLGCRRSALVVDIHPCSSSSRPPRQARRRGCRDWIERHVKQGRREMDKKPAMVPSPSRCRRRGPTQHDNDNSGQRT